MLQNYASILTQWRSVRRTKITITIFWKQTTAGQWSNLPRSARSTLPQSTISVVFKWPTGTHKIHWLADTDHCSVWSFYHQKWDIKWWHNYNRSANTSRYCTQIWLQLPSCTGSVWRALYESDKQIHLSYMCKRNTTYCRILASSGSWLCGRRHREGDRCSGRSFRCPCRYCLEFCSNQH